jgi:DNA repair exonuclease SbcCD nuclease subunit
MKAAHVGPAGAAVREERLAAARRVIELARREQVDFLVLAGDTFENNAVERTLVQRVADILAAAPCPVYVIPGNHDPFTPGSVWQHAAWQGHPRATILVEERPLDVPGGRLFPCPLREKHSPRDPTLWINATGCDQIAIGLAHGTVQGLATDELDYPIARNAAERAGLDYLALGHWHSFAPIDDGRPVRLAYSGTHETTKFGERESGQAVLVEIAARGAPPKLTPLRTGGLVWLSEEEQLAAPGDLARVLARIEALPQPQTTLLSLSLRGVLYPDEQRALGRIREICASRLRYYRLDESGLYPPPDEAWLDSLPAGLVRDVACELRSLAEPGAPRPGRDYATPEVARAALVELFRLCQEVAE